MMFELCLKNNINFLLFQYIYFIERLEGIFESFFERILYIYVFFSKVVFKIYLYYLNYYCYIIYNKISVGFLQYNYYYYV